MLLPPDTITIGVTALLVLWGVSCVEKRLQGENKGEIVGLASCCMVAMLPCVLFIGLLGGKVAFSTAEGEGETVNDCFERNSFNIIRASSPSGPVKLNNLKDRNKIYE